MSSLFTNFALFCSLALTSSFFNFSDNLSRSISANNLYKNRPASQTSTLKEQREQFSILPLSKQIHVIKEILKLFKCASATADFKLLEKGSTCGKIQVSTNITKCKQCILINQSPTGVFEQEVDLMKL